MLFRDVAQRYLYDILSPWQVWGAAHLYPLSLFPVNTFLPRVACTVRVSSNRGVRAHPSLPFSRILLCACVPCTARGRFMCAVDAVSSPTGLSPPAAPPRQ